MNMARSAYLASRLREVLLNGTWIANTNCSDQIRNTSWMLAVRQVSNLNSVALLTFHLNYYLKGLLHVLNGGQLEIRDKFSFDMPLITSEDDWKELVSSFLMHAEAFAQKVEALPDTLLDEPFTDVKYGSYLRNIEGVIEHSYYHLGQMVLIRKLMNE
jgi:hypothetical protein